jgi:hypothetical protein
MVFSGVDEPHALILQDASLDYGSFGIRATGRCKAEKPNNPLGWEPSRAVLM